MNDYPNSQLSRSNPLLLSTLQQQQQPSSASVSLSSSAASRLPSASAAQRNAAAGMSSSSLSLSSSLGSPLNLNSSAGLSRPSGLSLSGASPQLSSLHPQHLSSLTARQGMGGGGGGGGAGGTGSGLLGSLSGLGGLPVNGGLFSGGVLSPQSFSPDMALLLSHSSNVGAAAAGGGKSVGTGQPPPHSHSHSHSHSLSAGLAGLGALGHLGGTVGGLHAHHQQQQQHQQQLSDNGSLLDRDRDRERERERKRQNGPRFDMSEFPSLSEVVGGGPKESGLAVGMGHAASHSAGGVSNTGGGANMASLLSASSPGGLHSPSEFSMQTEEFPALSAARRPPGGSQVGRGLSNASSFNTAAHSSSASSLQQPISARTQSLPIGHAASPPSSTSSLSSLQSQLPSRGQSLSNKAQQPANNATNAPNIPSPLASPSVSPSSSATSASVANSSALSSSNPPSLSASPQLPSSHYGLPGLLSVIRMTDPDLNTLALGTDLTTLGLNLSSTEVLYATFAYPASASSPCISGPADYVLPYCYYMQPPALKTSHLSKFTLETLMYIFYMMPRDTLQVYAAKELYAREWRYHKDIKLWLTRSRRQQPQQPTSSAQQQPEAGDEYVFFDVTAWETRVFRDTHILQPHQFLGEEELASI